MADTWTFIPGRVNKSDIDTPVDLSKAYELTKKY